jgi:5-methyltetrahydropteroyltriglutamate--homocysteine methyltransferase
MLRPAWLKQARTDFAAGRISAVHFKRVEDRAVDEAIALQERCGVDLVTDGEMRRSGFVAQLTDYVEGFEAVAFDTRRWQGGGGASGETSLPVPLSVTGKLHRRRSLAAEEFIYARARAKLPLKATLPSPLMLAMRW